ncbi:BglG family transcription antiterminator [Paenibacillus alkalitolerans]|uniref:BglG family transcription antiterminator n=1 Tax=Paenibacillus alkalitolerans TaxID=2799335 RepID=UPI0018F4C90E|nr:BglG family transcription antiterminator [Paenibacillus alkalitolerans]
MTLMRLNSRQKHILLLLLESSQPLTLKYLSDELGLSIRTVQRELEILESTIKSYGLLLATRAGTGVWLEGSEDSKRKLVQELQSSNPVQIFTSEERQFILIQQLLFNKEPLKLFYFSDLLNVTDSTISNDLDRCESWFLKHNLNLIRKPGFGIHVEGHEHQIRRAILNLIYQNTSHDQLLDMLSAQGEGSQDKVKLEMAVRNKMLNFIDPNSIDKIEKVIQQTEREYGYKMADTAYVGLIIHIALAIHRLKSDENITFDRPTLEKLKETREFIWASRLSEVLGGELSIAIPESEIGYICTHLLGAKANRLNSSEHSSRVEHFVQNMVSIVEQELKVELATDLSLIEHLIVHLESSINRIQYNMDIRNPLLAHVKEKYPDVFQASEKAAAFLERQLGKLVPEEETGYLAMHFGAAVLRKAGMKNNRKRVLLVCASGMGTSKLLAAQLEQELPQVEIVDTISLLHVDELLNNMHDIDLIVSTVDFRHKDHEVIVVNPFMAADELIRIKERLNQMPEKRSGAAPKQEVDVEGMMSKLKQYSDALSQLQSNIFIQAPKPVRKKQELIDYISFNLPEHLFGKDPGILRHELIEREKLGAWVMKKAALAMLHCKSDALQKLCVCIVKCGKPIRWTHQDQSIDVRTVLVLLAPKQAPKEHFEIISEVSAALIEDSFIDALTQGHEDEIMEQVKTVVGKGYLKKIDIALRGKT